MEEDGTRRLRTWDLDLTGGQVGPLVVPGIYTARITAAGETVETQVEVLKDPTSTGTLDQIRAQVALSLALRDDLQEMGQMINRLEWIREQVEDLQDLSRVEADAEAVAEAAAQFREKLLEVESRLFDVNLSGAREDAFRAPMKIYGRMSALGSDVSRFSADFAPTSQQREVYDVLKARLTEARDQMDRLLQIDLPALNEQLRARGIPIIS
jgi:cell division protein ZapA (FtsZ GTPase activity inhibitor)